MLWIIGFLVLFVALAIPILAIVLDSPVLHRFMEARRGPEGEDVSALGRRLAVLEDEVDELSRAVQSLKDDTQFLQRLIESAEERGHRQLPPSER
jgi:hypothetical protein